MVDDIRVTCIQLLVEYQFYSFEVPLAAIYKTIGYVLNNHVNMQCIKTKNEIGC